MSYCIEGDCVRERASGKVRCDLHHALSEAEEAVASLRRAVESVTTEIVEKNDKIAELEAPL